VLRSQPASRNSSLSKTYFGLSFLQQQRLERWELARFTETQHKKGEQYCRDKNRIASGADLRNRTRQQFLGFT
jgi:hypothetical protein